MLRRSDGRNAILPVGLVLIGLAAALWVLAPPPTTRPPERLVLIVIDALRRDRLSPYGGALHTPHIQALADRGQVFSNVLASYHQTSMSMGALFTGRTPSIESRATGETIPWNGGSWCGLTRFAREGAPHTCVPEGLETLAERLRDAGYWTIGIASNELLYEPSGYAAGFDDWVEVGREADLPALRLRTERGPREYALVPWRWVNRAAVAALERRPRDRLFLYVHFMDVHNYFLDREPYDRTVERVDEAIGGLLHALERGGLLEGAVVFLTSDHGENLQEQRPVPSSARHLGNPSFQEVLRIPLVIAPPVAADPERFLRSEDLFRLILDVAGVEPRASPDLEPGELFVSEILFRTHIQAGWKLMEQRNGPRLHLFDLANDPGEQRDLAAANPGRLLRHRRRMDELSAQLAGRASGRALSDEDRRRLRALGYRDE